MKTGLITDVRILTRFGVRRPAGALLHRYLGSRSSYDKATAGRPTPETKKKAKVLNLCLSLFDLRIPYRFVFANAVDLRLPPQLKTVSLMARRPNLIASREVGVQMSI